MFNKTAFLLFFSQEVWTTPPSHHLQTCSLLPRGWLDFMPESNRCYSRYLSVYVYVCVFIHIVHHQWQSQLKNEIVLLLSFRFLPQLFLFLRAGPRVRAADGASTSTVPALSVWARQEPKNMESLSAFNEKPQAQRADVEESIRAEHPFLSFSQFRSVGDLSHTWRNVCHFLLFDNESP